MTETSGPVVSATRARQGIRGTGLFWVLLVSTLLAVVGLFAAWMWRAPQLARANSDNGKPVAASTTARSQAAPSVVKQQP
jgi:hypothetical protein